MSNSWDPTAFQPPGGGGGGGVKLFDPTQFQAPAHQQPAPHSDAEGDFSQQNSFQPPHSGAYFPQPQQGQGGQWDHWGNWNWSTEGQNAPIVGDQVEGSPPTGSEATAGQHPPARPFVGQNHHEPPADQAQAQQQTPFYNPQQYYGGGAMPEGTAGGWEAGFEAQWNWNAAQASYLPTAGTEGGSSSDQQQQQSAEGNNSQGQYYYQGQQPYFNDPMQPHQQWAGQAQPQVERQEMAAQFPSQEGGAVNAHPVFDHPVAVGGLSVDPVPSFPGGDGSAVTMMPPPLPSVDVTSHSAEPEVSPASHPGHNRQGSMDSNTSGTVAHFYGHGGDDDDGARETAQAQAPALPPGDPVSMQHLKVNLFQRTDSGISNASLQTVNLSADEEGKDEVDEVAAQLEALHVNQDHGPAAEGGQPSQLYAHPGDFSGFGNYSQAPPQVSKLNREEAVSSGAVSSGSGDSDLQSPMMNDWEIVPPPQAHSSASHSRNHSLDDGASFSSTSRPVAEPAGASVEPEGTKPPQAAAAPELNPAGTTSSSTQDSESFTAISSTSSAEVPSSAPFSQGSSYHPTASSTPLTSPGSQSVLSQPSSLPSWQSSPQQGIDASPTAAARVNQPPPASRVSKPTQQDSPVRNVPTSLPPPDSPEKVALDASQRSKESEKSLYSSAVSNTTAAEGGSQPSPVKGDAGSGRPPPAPASQGGSKQTEPLPSPSHRHHSAFHPVHSRRARHNMSPATSLWDNQEAAPTGNILLAPAAPLIIPSLGTTPAQNSVAAAAMTSTTTTTSTVPASSAQPTLHKSASNSSSLERLAGKDGARRSRERDGGRYTGAGYRRTGERNSLNKTSEELPVSRSRDEDCNRSLGSLDELDATPDFTDDSSTRGYRSRTSGRDPRDPRDPKDLREPRYEPYNDRPSSRSDSYRDDYRRPRDPRDSYRGYGQYSYRDPRDPYYDERYDRPRSRQDEERTSSRPSSRSAKDMDRPRSRTEHERDREGAQHRDPYRGGYPGYDGYGHQDYYYDDRERFYRYYRDSRYRHGYAEEMGQYYGQQPQVYDSREKEEKKQKERYAGYFGHPHPLPPVSRYPYVEDFDRSSIASPSRGQTPSAFDDFEPSSQDYYGRSSRPSSRSEREKDSTYAPGYGGGYGSSGYEGYGGYYDQYNQYQYHPSYYGYQQQYGDQQQQQQQGGYIQGRMTPPKHVLPHARVCFSPTGQLVTVLPTRPAEGQPPTVDIHDLHLLLQDTCPQVEELKAFPGPLVRNETHKNDVLLFCQTKARECGENVDMLDRDSAELIWRLLDLLLKQNGTIIGTDIADLLLAGHEPSTHEYKESGLRIMQNSSSDPLGTPDKEGDSGASSPAVTKTATDRTVITAAQLLEESTDRFRNLLLYGRKKEALDWGMKHNLWGHALFLASKMDQRTYASVMTRFANTAMRINDPLQTLYQLMSGRQPASVTNVVDERWGDWRPHLAMILSNHSTRPHLDNKSIVTLGDTLANKHCLHASHFCYLMAQVEFGSFFKKSSKIVLIGSNHNLPLWEFASNEAIQLTEVYEYACSLGNSKFCLPQFQVYKFLYACRLVEYGLAQEAFHYFEVIAIQVVMNPARFHPAFISILHTMSCHLKHGDPQKLHAGHDSADPEWLTRLSAVCQSYEEGSLQYQSGSATPALTGYGGQTPSSESGEVASYSGMDTANTTNTMMAGAGGVGVGGGGMHSQDASGAYAASTSGAASYQQYGGVGGEVVTGGGEGGEGAVVQQQQQQQQHQQAYTGAEQYGQSGDQYNWQQQQQQEQQQQAHAQQQQQQQYDASQYQQQQWQYDYSQGYSTEQGTAAQTRGAGYQGAVSQQGAAADTSAAQYHHQHHQQQQQHPQQVQAAYNYNSYAPPLQQQQHRHSLASQNSAAEQTEGDDDDDDDDDDDNDEDDVDGEAGPGGSNFDYFGAASQQKIVAPPSRYRTTSTSSTGSAGHRRRRTTSGSSTGSVRAAGTNNKSSSSSAPAPSKAAQGKAKTAQEKNGGGGGWLGGLFSKFGRGNKNEMKLPDDKDPSIVWDSVNKKWINKDGQEDDSTPAAPPPTDSDLMGKMAAPPSTRTAAPAAAMNGPSTANRFSMQRGRGARYVDVLNPGSGGGGGGGGSAPVPPSLFNVMPGGGVANTNTSTADDPGSTVPPQLFNPGALGGGSSSQSNVPSSQGMGSTLAPPPHDLSRSSSLSSLSREIQQLTMKAQQLGEEDSGTATSASDPSASQPGPSMPMMFNPTQLSHTQQGGRAKPTTGGATAAGGGGGGGGGGKMKYGQRRVYPK